MPTIDTGHLHLCVYQADPACGWRQGYLVFPLNTPSYILPPLHTLIHADGCPLLTNPDLAKSNMILAAFSMKPSLTKHSLQ